MKPIKSFRWIFIWGWIALGGLWTACTREEGGVEGLFLTPPHELREKGALVSGVEVVQAIPLAQGVFAGEEGDRYVVESKVIKGMAEVITRWPDHSVQWLRVSGVIREEVSEWGERIPLALKAWSTFEEAQPSTGDEWVECIDQKEIVLKEDGQPVAWLRPQAALVGVNKVRDPIEENPDFWDSKGQYWWAASVHELHEQPLAIPLEMSVRSCEQVENHAYRSVYLIRGEGRLVGEEQAVLEWQLRLENVVSSPSIQMEMTWRSFWNEQEWALAGASWEMHFSESWRSVKIAEKSSKVSVQGVSVAHNPRGESVWQENEEAREIQPTEWWVLKGENERFLGLALPGFSKLGPNRVQVKPESITIDCWNPDSELALDLRQTGKEEDFGRDRTDAASRPTGLSRTIECTLVYGNTNESVQNVVRQIASRDNQWFPSAHQLLESRVLGPIAGEVMGMHPEYFKGIQANAHFLKSSQERWKWYGYINYGDIRTNFSKWSREERGLYPKRWTWFGRYGWRNGAGDVPYGMLNAGLLLEDREIILMGLDYARHISDVDINHAPWFSAPQQDAGGMHRRNRDHWSGSVQMQYSPSNGLYLASWLTGASTIDAALAGVRDYALSRGSHSSFAAQAWINHYAETRKSEDLEIAWKLLRENADSWATRSPSNLKGLAALYDHNFRWYSDGVSTLERFYDTTGDREVLTLIRDIVIREMNSGVNHHPSLGYESGMGYLIGAGMTPDEIGREYLERGREYMRKLHPKPLPEQKEWDYDTLVEIVTELLPGEGGGSSAYLESASIGGRLRRAFFAMRLLEGGADTIVLQLVDQEIE